MSSIRLSLLVYFLGLLALALGAASCWSTGRPSETLSQKKTATAQADREPVRGELPPGERPARRRAAGRGPVAGPPDADDARLAARALTRERELAPDGAGAWAAAPNGQLTAPVWLAEAVRNPDRTHGPEFAHALSPFYAELYRTHPRPKSTSTRRRRTSWPCWNRRPSSSRSTARGAASYRSKSLGDHSFPIDPAGVRARPGAVVGLSPTMRAAAGPAGAARHAERARRPASRSRPAATAASPATATPRGVAPGRSSRAPPFSSSAPPPPPAATPLWRTVGGDRDDEPGRRRGRNRRLAGRPAQPPAAHRLR